MALRSNGPVMVALPPFRGVTRQLVLIAAIVYFGLLICSLVSGELAGLLAGLFSLSSDPSRLRLIWEVLTYPFISSGLFGTLFAALTIWFFGSALEEEFGSRWLLELFLVCTAAGAIAALLVSIALSSVEGFGPGHLANSMWPFSLALLLAFAARHPDQELNFNFLLRVKAKYMAALYLVVYLGVLLSQHERFESALVLCNAACGWAFFRLAPRRGFGFSSSEAVYGLRNAWVRNRRKRAAKQFTLYMQQQGRDVRFDEKGRYIDPDAERQAPKDRKWMN